jgi:hypothetical protein
MHAYMDGWLAGSPLLEIGVIFNHGITVLFNFLYFPAFSVCSPPQIPSNVGCLQTQDQPPLLSHPPPAQRLQSSEFFETFMSEIQVAQAIIALPFSIVVRFFLRPSLHSPALRRMASCYLWPSPALSWRTGTCTDDCRL